MMLNTEAELRALLDRSTSVAMVGASERPERPSNGVFRYLKRQGKLSVTPINPTIRALDGVAAFPSLQAYAAVHGAPDIVDVFRKPEEAAAVARDAIAVGARAIWFQLGVIDQEAIALANAAGLDVVVDRCIKIELARTIVER